MRTVLAIAVLLALLLPALTAPPQVQAQEGTPPPQASSTPTPVPDSGMGDSIVHGLLDGLQQGLPALLLKGVFAVIGSFATWLLEQVGAAVGQWNVITSTPPGLTYEQSQVLQASGTLRNVANIGLGLVAAWMGISIVVGGHIRAAYHEAMEIGPRILLGALLVNTGMWWAKLAIDANNALAGGLGSVSQLPGWESINGFDRASAQGLAVLAYVVFAALVLLQQLFRLALIDVLLVAMPAGLLCWVLPQTQRWARLWSGTFVGIVFCQFLQVWALQLGAALGTQLVGAGLKGLLSACIGIASFALALKIPGMIGASVHSGSVVGLAQRVAAFVPGVAAGGAAAGAARSTASGYTSTLAAATVSEVRRPVTRIVPLLPPAGPELPASIGARRT